MRSGFLKERKSQVVGGGTNTLLLLLESQDLRRLVRGFWWKQLTVLGVFMRLVCLVGSSVKWVHGV